MPSPKKKPTKFPGVRYYELPSRPSHKGKPDRYYSIRYRLAGKLKEEGLGWTSEGWTPERAQLVLAELKTAQITGTGPTSLAEKRKIREQEKETQRQEEEAAFLDQLTFRQVWNQYYPDAQANKSRGSWEREESLFRLWIDPVIGSRLIKDIKPLHLERIKKNMRIRELSDDSMRYALAVVRQVFNFAIRNGIFLNESPTKHVKFPHSDNRRLRFLTVQEANLLLDELSKGDQRVHDMALLSLDCGLRRGEIFKLTWQDVNIAAGTLTLRNTKNGRTRYAYTTSRVGQMLKRRAKESNHLTVFLGEQQTLITAITRSFGRALKKLGFNDGIEDARYKVVFHTLRHSYASRLAENGVGLYVIKELMGHRTLSMTERYAHLSDSAFRESVRVLESSQTNSSQNALLVAEHKTSAS